MENLLEDDWSYTIVTDADSFTHEFRSGGYRVYALFSEKVKLTKYLQKEIREAVYRGDGLIVAGTHDQRNSYLDEPLGIKFKGKDSKTTGLILNDLSSMDFAFSEQVQRFKLKGASSLGSFICGKSKKKNKHYNNDSGHSSCKQSSDIQDKHDDDNHGKKTDYDYYGTINNHHHQNSCQKSCPIAETYYEYGLGHSVSFAFDLLAQATAAGGLENPYANLLTQALNLAHIDYLANNTGNVIPVRLNLSNFGIATSGQAIITLPIGTNIIAPIKLEISEEKPALIWPFYLDVDQQAEFEFWPRLPLEAGMLDIQAQIQTGIYPNFKDYDNLFLEIQVESQPTLLEIISTLEALYDKDKYAKKALKYLRKADHLLFYKLEKKAKVLKELLKVTDNLQKSKIMEAHEIRLQVDHAIRQVELMIFIK